MRSRSGCQTKRGSIWQESRGQQAESGKIATISQIQRAYEAKVGHEVDESTMYRLLNRHDWPKLMPRPRHPQANPQEQEQFKKPLKRRLRQSSRPGQPKMNAQS